jgi:leader peptidase (prepilin peptidase)/N-methyltransferase
MDVLFESVNAAIVFSFGAAIGSFLNVVIYRLPAGLSLLHPPSRCPKCQRRLRKHHNIPVLGWLWLKGRCAYCKQAISWRYPFVEAITGILFLTIFWVFGFSWQTVGYWTFFGWLIALALIDLDTMTLPNVLTQSGLLVGLGFQLVWGGMGTETIAHLIHGITGAVLGIWLVDMIAIMGSIALGQTAMGAGDSKLAAMMGAWLGWKLLLLAGFLACAIGSCVGGAAIAAGWLDRRQPMPFGPFLAIGAMIVAIWGERLLSIYWRLFFPTL